LEAAIVHLSDRIAYINHDIDDALRGKVLKEEDLPKRTLDILGKSHRVRINTMIQDVVNNSIAKNHVSMTEKIDKATNELRNFLKFCVASFTSGEPCIFFCPQLDTIISRIILSIRIEFIFPNTSVISEGISS